MVGVCIADICKWFVPDEQGPAKITMKESVRQIAIQPEKMERGCFIWCNVAYNILFRRIKSEKRMTDYGKSAQTLT
jgi:hypothetical protein